MKKAIILTIFVSVIFLSGCSNKSAINNSTKPIDVKQDARVIQKGSNIFWKSSPQGDEVEDNRDPAMVCKKLQTEQGLNNCTIIISKKSENRDECVNGMSIAGCFACKFECP